MATSKILKTDGSNEINIKLSDAPSTYLESGRIRLTRWGNVCVISFTDIKVIGSPNSTESLYTGFPEAKYNASAVLIDQGNSSYFQRVGISADATAINNFYTTNTQRGSGQNFMGQLVYICK